MCRTIRPIPGQEGTPSCLAIPRGATPGFNPGSLLTALQRLERSGAIDTEWKQTEKGRRARIYTLTRTGRTRLDNESTDGKRRAAAVARLLDAEG